MILYHLMPTLILLLMLLNLIKPTRTLRMVLLRDLLLALILALILAVAMTQPLKLILVTRLMKMETVFVIKRVTFTM